MLPKLFQVASDKPFNQPISAIGQLEPHSLQTGLPDGFEDIPSDSECGLTSGPTIQRMSNRGSGPGPLQGRCPCRIGHPSCPLSTTTISLQYIGNITFNST